MPTKSKRVPSYRLHKPTNQAVTRIDGRDVYLGRHNSPESREKYDRLIAGWLSNGRQLPADGVEPLAVNELLLRYYRHCESIYGSRRTAVKRLSAVRCALRPVKELFGTTQAATFGPKALLLVRDRYIELGWSRKTINDAVQTVKAMFKWATREEITPPSTHHALTAVEGLRAGESTAPEPRNVQPVPDDHVEAVLPHVLPPVAAMIRLQSLSGMRPGEVVIMRGADLDMTGPLWTFSPQWHKSDRRAIRREIVLGPKAQTVIREFLRANLEEYLFRPDEAEADRDAERRKGRNTPLWPSHLQRYERKRMRHPKRRPGERYNTDTYAQAIRRACDRADVPIWTPNRLRHSYATKIRKAHGIEAARVMLGHQHVGVSEVYAERDHAVAATIARKIG